MSSGDGSHIHKTRPYKRKLCYKDGGTPPKVNAGTNLVKYDSESSESGEDVSTSVNSYEESNVSKTSCGESTDNESNGDESEDEYSRKNITKKKCIPHVRVEKKAAFNGCTKTYKITIELNENVLDVENFFHHSKIYICQILKTNLSKMGQIKAVFSLQMSFTDNEYNTFDVNYTIYADKMKEHKAYFELARGEIISKYEALQKESDEDIQIVYLDLHVHKTQIKGDISVQKDYQHLSEFIVTVEMSSWEVPMSFKWAVLSALHPEVYAAEEELERFSSELNLEGIQFPVKLDDIPKIEELNDISFNVFVMKYNFHAQKEIIEGPVYHTKYRRDTHVNLLLVYDENENCYFFINNLRKLVNPKAKGLICDGCLCFFDDNISLRQHLSMDCLRKKMVMSSKSEKFIKNENKIPLPLVIYADFEALVKPINNCNSNKNSKKYRSYTINVGKHVLYSFAFFVKCRSDDSLSCLECHVEEENVCESMFMKLLICKLGELKEKLKNFDSIEYVPIYFHNFINYDSHFIIKAITESVPGKTSVLGSKNKLKAIHKYIEVNGKNIELRFLDSCSFLKGSIENLARDLDSDNFYESCRFWKLDDDDELLTLLTQKGVFPYEYITSLADLEKTSLPKKEYFYDSLKGCHATEDDYNRALTVWERFDCKTILDYALLYLKTDVLILTDLFENLRSTSLATYGLDPARYYSMSNLSWDAMLKVTGVELELITDVSMWLFLKRSMRGGIAHCTKRHAVANNKYLLSYNENIKDSYLMYYDANNLYGWAMRQHLPYGGFEWADSDENFDVPAHSDVGYFVEVDLEYPDDKKLHDLHADYPFCPQKKKVSGVSGDRVVTDLISRKKYVLHHSYLSQCKQNGLQITKVHRVLKFNQKPWLKPYVDMNTKLRKSATSASDRDFYKMMNNSIYGKTIMNTENYVDVQIASHWSGNRYNRGGNYHIGTPEYHSHGIVSDNVIIVQKHKTKIDCKTPTYVGYSILDLSKVYMYDFHYNFMKKKFGKKLKLLYTDTDSFVYQIFTKDYYADMRDSLKSRFDTSNYLSDNKFGYPQLNKQRVGYFKDECEGSVVREFIALRPKVYMIEAEGKTIKKASSAPNVVRDRFTIDDYRQCLYNKEPVYKEWYQIRAVDHQVFTQRARKAVLQPQPDFKRHWLEDGMESLPFGHYRLKMDGNN